MSYMILGICWWGLLLHQKNQELYLTKFEYATTESEKDAILSKLNRQTKMIVGEGAVLILSLLAGIYIINRSAKREIKNVQQQTDFVLSVSHELKSPIAAIKLALQTLLRPGLSPDKESKFIRSAINDTKRLESLVQNVLTSASIVGNGLTLHTEKIDLIPFVEKAIKKLNLSESVAIKSDAHHLWVSGDQLFLNQAISNLVDNAVKYATNKSDISISLGVKDTAARCTISNPGPPIPESEQEKIFEKFYRGQQPQIRKQEGTGIGLYIAHQIILEHKGYITVESANGYNRFHIILPINVA